MAGSRRELREARDTAFVQAYTEAKRAALKTNQPVNGAEIALSLGFPKKDIGTRINKMLRDPTIADAIRQALEQPPTVRDPSEITPARVIMDWWNIHNTNVTELIEYRRDSCRFCYGQGFLYQYTPSEMRQRQEEYKEAKANFDAHIKAQTRSGRGTARRYPAFDVKGGIGFDPRRPPHQSCPECHGRGVLKPYPHDTRTLSPGARRLYAGVKAMANGAVEVLLRNQDRALELVAKHLGMLIDRREQGKPGEFDHLTTEEAEQRLVDELVAGGIPEEAARAFVRTQQSQ